MNKLFIYRFCSIVLSYGAIIWYYQKYLFIWIIIFIIGLILTILKWIFQQRNNKHHIKRIIFLDISAIVLAWLLPLILPRFQLINGYEVFSTIAIASIGGIKTMLEQKITSGMK